MTVHGKKGWMRMNRKNFLSSAHTSTQWAGCDVDIHQLPQSTAFPFLQRRQAVLGLQGAEMPQHAHIRYPRIPPPPIGLQNFLSIPKITGLMASSEC